MIDFDKATMAMRATQRQFATMDADLFAGGLETKQRYDYSCELLVMFLHKEDWAQFETMLAHIAHLSVDCYDEILDTFLQHLGFPANEGTWDAMIELLET